MKGNNQSEEEPVVPVRFAAIDVGSNALRFLAAEFAGDGSYDVLDQVRVPVRLGHDVFLTGKLTAEAMDAAIDAFKTFRRKIEALDISKHRAVATSAVRESRNGKTLIERAREEADIKLEAIHGAEEARLVHLAVRSRIRLGRQKWLVADLGGGSVEVSIVDEHGIHRTESHEMGSVRLLEELAVAGEAPGQFRRKLEEYTAALRNSRMLHAKVAGYIATGGNIEAIARLGSAPVDSYGVATLPLNDLRALVERLARMSYNDRVQELGLREDRADVILPAAMVYERIAVLAGVDSVFVPNVGVKDGVILDLFEQHSSQGRRRGMQDRTLLSGALALGRRFHFDEAHGRHVAKLAVSLFDQLRDIHELGQEEKKLLQVAALLHDIGTFISLKRHHKHSWYIISQCELAGLDGTEIDVVANVARYHRKSPPGPTHEPFMKLSERDRERVMRLSALLRLADALDREHLQRVDEVKVIRAGKSIELKVHGRGDLLLEKWALQKKAQMFEKLFDVPVTMDVVSLA